MMRRTSEIDGYGIRATDGSIGAIADLLFDDENWTARWVVVDTGSWLSGRKVLLPPSCFGRPDTARQEFPVDLTRQRVEDSPGIDTDAPVSRQMETDLYGYYGWAPYWPVGFVPPISAAGVAVPPQTGTFGGGDVAPREPAGDQHLHSVGEVTGYYIHATDDDIGHVEDFLVDGEDWAIRYMVVDTRNWWPGKKVLVSPRWIDSVSWADRQVRVGLTRAQVKDSPEYDPSASIDRGYEERLHRHYDYPPYWA